VLRIGDNRAEVETPPAPARVEATRAGLPGTLGTPPGMGMAVGPRQEKAQADRQGHLGATDREIPARADHRDLGDPARVDHRDPEATDRADHRDPEATAREDLDDRTRTPEPDRQMAQSTTT
jgi:hypothetical protein